MYKNGKQILSNKKTKKSFKNKHVKGTKIFLKKKRKKGVSITKNVSKSYLV